MRNYRGTRIYASRDTAYLVLVGQCMWLSNESMGM